MVVLQNDRITGLDVARGWALALALLMHSFQKTGVDAGPLVYMIVRTSTPIFMILFGAMIAVAYLPRYKRYGMSSIVALGVSRSIQCYLLFAINVIALAAVQDYSWLYTLLCLSMGGVTPYAGMLQYYAIMFLLLPFFVLVALKSRPYAFVAVACTVHLLYPLFKMVPSPPPVHGQPVFGRILALLFGTGNDTGIAGPSILHSLVFVAAGIWLGKAFFQVGSKRRSPATSLSIIPLLTIFLIMAIYSLSLLGISGFSAENLGSMHLRNLNHPAYTFIEGGISLITVVASARLFKRFAAPALFLALGRRSLFGFGWGNVIIVLWPDLIAHNFGHLASCALLFVVICGVTVFYDAAFQGPVGRPSTWKTVVRKISKGSYMLAEKVGQRTARKLFQS